MPASESAAVAAISQSLQATIEALTKVAETAAVAADAAPAAAAAAAIAAGLPACYGVAVRRGTNIGSSFCSSSAPASASAF